MINFGTMVKTPLGKVSTNGVLHDIAPHIDMASPNARVKTLEKIQAQKSLRVEIQRAAPCRLGMFKTYAILI
jgi:hypothetical protein